ncbi:methylmalonyl Co-A mutase-associated GTPase MeaB [Phytohabitans kaempferiae]|uniref:Methylmalonyl Co-A mutase-associated GTPase MeaB n=1 Tax=Phytohabitans kaempferiae TaxID=1620943 RepID=A0ABV6M5B8_9ACTN
MSGGRPVDIEEYAAGVRSGSRAWIGRAITLVESTRPDHRALAQQLLVRLGPAATRTRRIGVTGVPGVGKSTFIDALGSRLTAAGHRVAVLAVDPSSTRTGGSILGDKTRMSRLAADPRAFVRPSPTAGTLGGVAAATREAVVVVEAAGYDTVIVETVGVGQSETTVADMVDTFLLLALARTGDQLQGIKKGVLEIADVIAVNKADGPHATDARRAARELSGALRLLRGPDGAWQPPVVTCSALDGTGLDDVWRQLVRHHDTLAASGDLDRRRRRQQLDWIWATVRRNLLDRLRTDPTVIALTPRIEREVLDGAITPAVAADRILAAFTEDGTGPDRAR